MIELDKVLIKLQSDLDIERNMIREVIFELRLNNSYLAKILGEDLRKDEESNVCNY